MKNKMRIRKRHRKKGNIVRIGEIIRLFNENIQEIERNERVKS